MQTGAFCPQNTNAASLSKMTAFVCVGQASRGGLNLSIFDSIIGG